MRSRIILAFHIALIYYTQDFRVYEGTRDQPMPGPFPAPPIFLKGKALGTRLFRDGTFTNWKFGFDSDPRLHDLQLLVLGLFHFAF